MRCSKEEREEGESPVLKRDNESELIALFKLKKGNDKSKRRRKKTKVKPDTGDICLSALKKKASDATSTKKRASLEPQGNSNEKDTKEATRTKKRRRRKKKRQKDKLELDEALRLQRRTRYLLIKMKLEQNLIDAYSTEGWKGQSREKIKPEKELQRARKQILECKLGIRDAIRQLDSLSSVGSIEEKVIAPDGSVHHEHIFCAKCTSREAFPDNDILLCDGTCNRAFHQWCLDPPLDTDKIPPGDQGWFCKFCLCKMDIIEAMNAHIGTHFPLDSNWQDIFVEEAAFPNCNCGLLDAEGDWPSDDSQDDDYNPDKWENGCNVGEVGSDDDSNGSISTSLSWSSYCNTLGSEIGECEGNNKGNLVETQVDSDSGGEIIFGRRQRRAVDYKKLYDEMFGKDALLHEQLSEDEDWGPRKRRRKKENDAADTPDIPEERDTKCSTLGNTEGEEKLPSDEQARRPAFRIPRQAVEKLRQVFAKNELPSKTVKENLSKELGLEPDKVSKWFKNARYMALKTRKTEGERQLQSSVRFSNESEVEAERNINVVGAAWEDITNETHSHNPENSAEKMNQQRKKIVSCSTTRSSQAEGDSLSSHAEKYTVGEELSDDVSLKRLLKPKKARESRKSEVGNTELPAEFEAEMERLCRIKNRVEDMKQRILRLKNERGRKLEGRCRFHEEPSVMYLPTAELKEKDSYAASQKR